MAEKEPQKAPGERLQERMRFGLAVVGRKALDLAKEQGFPTWAEFEVFLRELFDPTGKAVPARPDPAAAPAAPGGAAPAAPSGPLVIATEALEAMEANGVDEQLLLEFLGGQGSGPAGAVTADDVERYLHA